MAIKPGTSQPLIIPDLENRSNQSELDQLKQQLVSIDLTLKNVWKPLSASQKSKLLKTRAEVAKKIQDLDTVSPQAIKQFELIAKKCSQYIQGAQQAGSWLYRGYPPESSSISMDSFVAATWSSKSPRQPRDSDITLSRIYDQVLKKHEFKTLRLLSIFTSGDKSHAEFYGEADKGIYIIMPVNGKSNMLWTAQRDIELYGIGDLFMSGNLNMYKDEVELAVDNSKLSAKQKIQWQMKFYNFPTQYKFDIVSFQTCVNMVQEQFHNGNPLDLPAYIKKMKNPIDFVNQEKFMQHYRPQTGSWSQAISSKHEVCVSGVYYAFRSSIFENWLNSYFDIKKG
jgi:hypothetical protein